MSRREAKLLVGDIIDSAEKILAYTQGMTYDDFIADEKTVDAVIRNFEIIGEAANRLPLAFKLLIQKLTGIKCEDLEIALCTTTLVLITPLFGKSKRSICPICCIY